MPIYEYICKTCRKRSALLILNLHNPPPVRCRCCGSSEMDRLMSPFSSPKSEEARLASLADSGDLGGLDENDPQSVASFMKKMGREMGEDISEDMEAMMDQAEDHEASPENADSE